MKTFIYSSFLAIAVLVSSCGSLGFTKRKYRKGYHWSVAKHAAETDKKEIAKHTTASAIIVETSTKKAEATEKAISPQTENTAQLAKHENSYKPAVKQKPFLFHAKADENKHEAAKELASTKKQVVTKMALKPLPKTLSKSKAAKSDEKKIIIILLCIFLPFLGVYLFQDDITLDFWIDLILCLLLFWLPGIIYAFLVCFGGVSLAK